MGLGWHTFRHRYRSLLNETGAPIGVQENLMRRANVATTMDVYGNATLQAKQQANSKVVQMVIRQKWAPSQVATECAKHCHPDPSEYRASCAMLPNRGWCW